MSYKAAYWAAAQRGIGPYAKVLLQQLADRHNPDNGCFPNQETLARDCEFSRSTINEQLRKLEHAGLVKRVSVRHPVTQRQMPTRYYLAFEEGFGEIANADNDDAVLPSDDQSRVREPDTENEPSRVRETGGAESGSDPEPCPPGRTHIEGLTSKLISKGTGKRAVRADRGSLFEVIWKAFPLRPGSPHNDAWQIFEKIDDADLDAVAKGAERYSQWFREEASRKGETLQDASAFAPFLVNWLKGQKWLDAKTLPIAAKSSAEAEAIMAGKISVNKWTHHDLFTACEAVRGTGPAPVGKSGTWSFATDIVEEAKRRLAAKGSGPP